MAASKDHIVRAITNDGAFRVLACSTTDTAQGVIAAQRAKGTNARRLGELITGTILVRETMAPGLRVQAILQSATGKGSLVGDAHPEGLTRGLLNVGANGAEIELGPGALLQVVRTLPTNQVHQGIVTVDGGISDALMRYMQDSEQVLSVVAVGCTLDADRVVLAGGFLIQVLPEIEIEPLRIVTERLESLASFDATLEATGGDPGELLSALLADVPFTRVNDSPLHFGCTCDEVRVLGALATLGRAEIQEILRDEEIVRVSCDYCRTDYSIPPAKLRGLLEGS